MSEAAGSLVAEQFSGAEQQRQTGELGMWVFLLSELLLFATVIVSALVLRVLHPASVAAAAQHLKLWIGGVNTAVLITSSLCMSAAIAASRLKAGQADWRRRTTVRCLHATAALGGAFLVLKGYEYWRDYAEHMMPFLPGRPFVLAADAPARLFVSLYYVATSLHAVHLMVGIGLLLLTAHAAAKPGFLSRHANRIPITGLYWHFIDLVWIVVFPTLYVLAR